MQMQQTSSAKIRIVLDLQSYFGVLFFRFFFFLSKVLFFCFCFFFAKTTLRCNRCCWVVFSHHQKFSFSHNFLLFIVSKCSVVHIEFNLENTILCSKKFEIKNGKINLKIHRNRNNYQTLINMGNID